MKKTMLFAIDKLGVTEENLSNCSMDDFIQKLRGINASFGIRTLPNGMDRIEIVCYKQPFSIKNFEEKLHHLIMRHVESVHWIAWKLH